MKKNLIRMNKKTLLLLVLTLSMAVVVSGCLFDKPVQESQDMASEYLSEQHVGQIDTGNTSIDFAGEVWPDDVPGYVPEFKYGELDTVLLINTNVKAWQMIFADTEEGTVDKYANDLRNEGWIIHPKEMARGVIFAEKNDIAITLEIGLSEENEAILTVSYKE